MLSYVACGYAKIGHERFCIYLVRLATDGKLTGCTVALPKSRDASADTSKSYSLCFA